MVNLNMAMQNQLTVKQPLEKSGFETTMQQKSKEKESRLTLKNSFIDIIKITFRVLNLIEKLRKLIYWR